MPLPSPQYFYLIIFQRKQTGNLFSATLSIPFILGNKLTPTQEDKIRSKLLDERVKAIRNYTALFVACISKIHKLTFNSNIE